MKCWQTSLNSNKNSLNNNNYICTMTMIIIMWFLLSILFCCRNRSAFNHNANCIKQIQRYKNNTDHRSAARGPLPPLLSIIRTGNEACGRGNKQFFLHWKQGTAIFWAVWVAVVCLCICVCVWTAVSTPRHVLFVKDPQKAMSLAVALCHCDFLNPPMYSWFIARLYLLSCSDRSHPGNTDWSHQN